jgi:uncharacterized Tic20 family protein
MGQSAMIDSTACKKCVSYRFSLSLLALILSLSLSVSCFLVAFSHRSDEMVGDALTSRLPRSPPGTILAILFLVLYNTICILDLCVNT